jgi:hypothetical protein
VGGGAKEPKGHREKRGSGAVNIAAREKILGIATVAAKKGPSDLRGKKKKPNKRPKNKFRKSTKKYDNM